VTRKFFGLLLAYRWGSLVRVGILWSHWVSLIRVGFWRKRPSNRSSWVKKFFAGVGIPAVNVADNRSASKSLYCHLTALEPCTEAFSKSSVVGRLRAGMALIAALSGSRRHSSARPALSQPRCTGRDIHSPNRREVKFSRHDSVRPSVGLRRKGSKSAISSHKNCRRAGVHDKNWWLFRTPSLRSKFGILAG
jgi:hypothetical protein